MLPGVLPHLAVAAAASPSATSPADAFGSRIGQESVGLYTESLVRGFSPQDGGNFRLEDAFYARAAQPTDALAARSEIRVGPNALDLEFPSPSGVIQYRLLPGEPSRRELQLGLLDATTERPRPFTRAFATFVGEGASLAAGLLAFPDERYADGSDGRYLSIGAIPRWQPSERLQLTGILQYSDWRTEADALFRPAPGTELPYVPPRRFVGPRTTGNRTEDDNIGALLDFAVDERWRVAASAIRSRSEQAVGTLHLLSAVDPAGTATLTSIVARDRLVESVGGELRATRSWTADDRRGRLTFAARGRETHVRDPSTTVLSYGRIALDAAGDAAAPGVPDTPLAGGRADVRQTEFGIAGRIATRAGHQANVGLRRVHLDDRRTTADGATEARDTQVWLHDAALVVPLGPSASGFAAATRGLEESGSAPADAVNAFEVLPAVLVRQREAGIKLEHARATTIATLFDLQRPDAGIDAAGRFRTIGDVRHVGIELSARGRVGEDWTWLVGATAMRQRLRSALGAGREVRPVGRAERLGLVAVNWAPREHRWSVDAQFNYAGRRPADAGNLGYTPAAPVLNVGGRLRLGADIGDPLLRVRVLNVFDRYEWIAGGSGLQTFVAPRRVEVTWTWTG